MLCCLPGAWCMVWTEGTMRVKLGGTTRAGNLGIDTILRNLRCAQDAKADRVLRSSVSLAACDAGEVKSDARKIGGGLCGDHRGFVVLEWSRQGLSATLEEHATKAGSSASTRLSEAFSALFCTSLCRSRFTLSLAPPWRHGIPNRACWPDCTATRREDPYGVTVRAAFLEHEACRSVSHCMQAVWQCALNPRGVRSYREVATDVATIASLGCVLNRAEHRMLTV